MKFVINPFLRAILIIAAWLLCIRQVNIDFNHNRFLNFSYPSLVVLASIISLFSFLVDYLRYKEVKRPAFFSTTAISILCIAALIMTSQYLKQQDNTPTILYASRFYNGLNSISIDFRENGTYKCEKGSFMGDSYYTRGHYSIKDSVIYLDKSNLYDLIKTDKLLIKSIPKNAKKKKRKLLALLFGSSRPDTLPETYLFQLNQRRDTMSSAIALRVNDNVVGYHD